MSESNREIDTWMNPPKRDNSWSTLKRAYPRYLIERKRRLDYYPFEKWDFWSSHDSQKSRDEELARLKEAHPVWRLRARNEHEPRAYL